MQSRTSFFNGALFRKTMARFWPIWFIYFAIWFVALPLVVSASMTWQNDAASIQHTVLETAQTGGLVIGGLFAAFTAMAVWSFLYSARSVSGTASLPLRRENVFFSVTLGGLVPLLAANVLIFLFSLFFEAIHGQTAPADLAEWLAVVTLQLVYYYGFAVFCAQLTGSIFVLPLVYAVLNFVAYVVEALVRVIGSAFIYGMYGSGGYALSFLSPPVEMYNRTEIGSVMTYVESGGYWTPSYYYFSGWHILLIYALAGLVFAAAALLLYRRRRMESAGDVVAVKCLRPVFKYCMTFGCALCLSWLVYISSGLMYGDRPAMVSMLVLLALMLCGAFIGYFVSEMLIAKSFRVWRGRWLGLAVSAAVIVALMFAAEFDLFGYERYVPDAGQLASVTVDCAGESTTFYQADNILSATDVHRSAAGKKDVPRGENAEDEYVVFNYELQSGRRVTRAYDLYYNTADKSTWTDVLALQTLLNTDEAIAARKQTDFPFTADTIVSGGVNSMLTAEEYAAAAGTPMQDGGDAAYYDYSLTPAETQELYNDCILPDIADGTLGRIWLIADDEYRNTVYSASVYIYASDPSRGDSERGADYFYTVPTVDSSRTNAWLKAHGVIMHTVAEVGGGDKA